MINDIKGYHKNPRNISERQFSDLRRSMMELGDLAGIVIDKNSGEIIGGNMRDRVIDLNNSKIEWLVEYKELSKTGTRALGFVEYEGERYSVRLVEWTPEQCELANIRANKMGGVFDFDMLMSEFETSTLLNSGFTLEELSGADFDDLQDELEGVGEGVDEGSGSEDAGNAIVIYFDLREEAEDALDKIQDFVRQMYPSAIAHLKAS